MEFLYVIILILVLLLFSKVFSYIKNQEMSKQKVNPKESLNKKCLELQEKINAKKEEKRNSVKEVNNLVYLPSIIPSVDDIESHPWRQFEREIAQMFADRWFEVILWPWIDDDWKDIVIRRGLEVYLIQCKHYYWKMVSVNEIRDFQWAIDLYEKKHNMVVRWIFITSWKSSSKSRQIAKILGIDLWDKFNWKDKINSL